ncbi:GNAT family N-acetyltransferase [Costertonia aggregata]|uniref:GNAT family N-acetyltransferase n=1 Tax=Costertonia aggregata TaxID=343403 RepID=A0A7H9ATB6_9FLAO|nr:GNAT family N-acetyltransferase [Costertonia aggregata]QLG46689.1 GNAT family N-acetyltransferase [Costertonia aggregata]
MKKSQLDFFFEFYEKKRIPEIYSNIIFKNREDTSVIKNVREKTVHDKIYSIFFIPEYIVPQCKAQHFKVKKIDQYFKGYALDLSHFDSADAYIKNRFRSNAKTIRKRARRLETCFDITTKMFYGSIDRADYDILIDKAFKMIQRRFDERQAESHTLTQWDRIKTIFFSLINEKKASMYVIYDSDKPIAISLGHHFHGKLFSLVSAYDIDYSKFSLGNIEIYRKIDWCLKNEHYMYELGMGDLDYKREWSNNIYNFQHQVLYSTKNILTRLSGFALYCKAYCKELCYKKAYEPYDKVRARIRSFKRKKETMENTAPQVDIVQNPVELKTWEKIPFENSKYDFLKRHINDFLYMAIENKKNLTAYKMITDENKFLIKTSKQAVTVQFVKSKPL